METLKGGSVVRNYESVAPVDYGSRRFEELVELLTGQRLQVCGQNDGAVSREALRESVAISLEKLILQVGAGSAFGL